MKLLKTIPLLFILMYLTSCGDDDKQFCAQCSNDQEEVEFCADSEAALDVKTNDFMDNSSGSSICINDL